MKVWKGHQINWLFAMIMLLAVVPSSARGQSCHAGVGGWQPTSVSYVPPTTTGGMATLVFAPGACDLFYSTEVYPFPATLSLVGSDATLTATLVDITGVGVPTPPLPVEITVPELAPGQYVLHTSLTTTNGFVIPDATLTLIVGGVTQGIPANKLWMLMCIGGLLLASGFVVQVARRE